MCTLAEEVPDCIPAPLVIPKVQETRPFRAFNGRSGTGGAPVRARTPPVGVGSLMWHGKSLLLPRVGFSAVPVLTVHEASALEYPCKLGAVTCQPNPDRPF